MNLDIFNEWRKDWNKFAYDVLDVRLDKEQQKIIDSVQYNRMTSVASGTARGKDFTTGVACVCFMYLTPTWNTKGEMIENTKVAMTAPTDRQVGNIMFPEIARIFNRVKNRFEGGLPGRLTGYDIRTESTEWFLTGFKADSNNTEAWTGFHASNVMFAVTEASGMSESIFNAIEGNLQGNSRLLIVFNPNVTTGYAALSQSSSRFHSFRLDSLNAPNVLAKKIIHPGQVDYEWIKDKVDSWCEPITKDDFNEGKGDFEFDDILYRPNDLFRVKIRGMFPEAPEDVLIPLIWVQLANERWREFNKQNIDYSSEKIGVDVAGMGRDSTCFCSRMDNYVAPLEMIQSGGEANHMAIAGRIANKLDKNKTAKALIDTIGEGAGVYSRLEELGYKNAYSCKFSEGAKDEFDKPLTDETGVYKFENMRAYLYWALRDWLNPANKQNAMLPDDKILTEELTNTKWKFKSNGNVIIEPKEDIKERLKRSPDKSDSLANTFYPNYRKGRKRFKNWM